MASIVCNEVSARTVTRLPSNMRINCGSTDAPSGQAWFTMYTDGRFQYGTSAFPAVTDVWLAAGDTASDYEVAFNTQNEPPVSDWHVMTSNFEERRTCANRCHIYYEGWVFIRRIATQEIISTSFLYLELAVGEECF